MNNFQSTYFNIKNFTTLSLQEFKTGSFRKMVEGLWYKYEDPKNPNSEMTIVVNFPLNFMVNEESLQEVNNLNESLAVLSGEKSNLSNLLARLYEKEKLLKELINTYQEQVEEAIVNTEKSFILGELEKVKIEFAHKNQAFSTTKTELKETVELLNNAYKNLKNNEENDEFTTKLNELKKRHSELLSDENSLKLEIELLKEDIAFYNKAVRKPLTNIDIEKRVKRDKNYQDLQARLREITIITNYVDKLDNSQDEKSLVIRSIKSVQQSNWGSSKVGINFQS